MPGGGPTKPGPKMASPFLNPEEQQKFDRQVCHPYPYDRVHGWLEAVLHLRPRGLLVVVLHAGCHLFEHHLVGFALFLLWCCHFHAYSSLLEPEP